MVGARRAVALALALSVSLALALAPTSSRACCALLVSAAGPPPVRGATSVVALRSGRSTVLTVATEVIGPSAGIALVVPVPDTAIAGDARFVARELVDRIDAIGAPRLVETWERDPCDPGDPLPADALGPPYRAPKDLVAQRLAVPPAEASPEPAPKPAPRPAPRAKPGSRTRARPAPPPPPSPITLLNAEESAEIGAWLKAHGYAVPPKSAAELAGYAAAGARFLVARPPPETLGVIGDHTALPPLRLRVTNDRFVLPVGLGAANAAGVQDLVVSVLAKSRVEPLGSDAAFAPTNVEVSDGLRGLLPQYYEGVLQATLSLGTVVTEYAWDASSCDPCATAPMDRAMFGILGGDVTGQRNPARFVLTRLHLRHLGADPGAELSLREAGPVVGGVGLPGPEGRFAERGAVPGPADRFQTRFVAVHPYSAPLSCTTPRRGVWGGPPAGELPTVPIASSPLFDPVEGLGLAEIDALTTGDRVGLMASRAPTDAAGPVQRPTDVPERAATAEAPASGCASAPGSAPGVCALVAALLSAPRRRRVTVSRRGRRRERRTGPSGRRRAR